jgi:hypothetical protein
MFGQLHVTKISLLRAGGKAFEVGLIFRVAAPSRVFEGAERLIYFLSDDLDSFFILHQLVCSLRIPNLSTGSFQEKS